MTFNVLADCFPWFVELAIVSPVRFRAFMSRFEELDVDVVGLNEVTPTLWSMMLESDFVRQRFVVSHTVETLLRPHCAVLLSRLPVLGHFTVQANSHLAAAADSKNSNRNRFPAFVVQAGPGETDLVAVCALHSRAYQTLDNRTIRGRQINVVAAALRDEMRRRKASPANVIIMGDLNLHYRNEQEFVFANDMLDLWAETHLGASGDQEEGYTFDALRNSMIPRYIPGEVRRMRLDRVLVGRHCNLTPTAPTELWGTLPVDAASDEEWSTQPTASSWAVTGKAKRLGLLRAPREITLSDHFGLVQSFAWNASSTFDGDATVREKMQALVTEAKERDPRTRLGVALSGVVHVGWLALRASSQL